MEDIDDDIYNVENTNGWSKEKDDYLKQIANRNGALVWMHNHAATHYIIVNKIWSIVIAIFIIACSAISIPSIVIPPPSTTITDGNSTVTTVDNVIPVLSLSMQILTIIACIISIIQTIVALDNVAGNHTDAASKSSDLYLFILKELRERRLELRIDGNRFVHIVIEKDSAIKNNSPNVPQFQVRKYYKYFGAKAIPYDKLFEENELLQIDESLKELKHDRAHAESIVNNIIMRATNRSNPINDDALEDKIQSHKTKYVRKVPALSKHQMDNLENYLNA